MKKNETQTHLSGGSLKNFIKLSGLRQNYVATKFGIHENYLAMILSERRRSYALRIRIYNYLLEYSLVTNKIAA